MYCGIISSARRRSSSIPGYATNESLAEQSTTGVTSLTGAAITFTPASGTDYLFFWSQDVSVNSTSNNAISDVTIGGSSIFTIPPLISVHEPSTPVDYNTHGGIFRVQGAGAAKTITAKGSTDGTGTPTLTLRNSRLSYVKLGPNDAYVESLARQAFASPGNKSLTTVASVSFTSASSGDYYIIASFNWDMAAAANTRFEAILTDGSTQGGGAWWCGNTATDRAPGMVIFKMSAVSGAKTVNLQIAQPSSGTGSIGISEIRIVALRADRFASAHFVASGANSSGTDSTYVTAASQTFTPANADHLSIAAWALASTSATASAFSQFLDDTTTVNEFIRELSPTTSEGIPAVSHNIANYAATSRTQAIQRHGEGAVNNNVQSPAVILTLELTGI